MDADGENQKRLTRIPLITRNPSWSPDGQRIAFDTFTDLHLEIYVMDSDGSKLRKLTDNLVFGQAPAWSHDGRTIAFERVGRKFGHSGIHLMTSDGNQLKRLSNPIHNDYHPDWFDPRAWAVSPTGNRITIWGRLKKLAPSLR